MDFLWFVVFSMLEATAIAVMMLRLFRFDSFQYKQTILISSLVFSLLSFALHVQVNISDYFPLITLVYFALFCFYVLKVPLFWSFIMSLGANIINFALQTLIGLVGVSMGFMHVNEFQASGNAARAVQLIFAVIAVTISHLLYRKGIGFAFNFDRFRWKAENIFMIIIVLILFVALFFTFMKRELYVLAVFEILLLSLLVYMAIRKERADLD